MPHKIFNLPNDDQYIWRYIKPNRIDNFLNGEIYFSTLNDFDDYYEAITPLQYFLHRFIKRHVGMKFDLSKPLDELDSESAIGNMLMWVSIYDIQKKVSLLTGITNEEELSKKVYEYCDNMSQFILPHIENQQKYYASCWFVGDWWESAHMWTSYSKPGGIAVRIKFSDFKIALLKFLERYADSNLGVCQTYFGLVKYKNFDDAEDWLKDINDGVPLPFFKQHFFKEEKEFRIILERESSFIDHQFSRLNKVFAETTPFKIILHPSASPQDLLNIQEKIFGNKFLKVSLSDMDYNNRFFHHYQPEKIDMDEEEHPF